MEFIRSRREPRGSFQNVRQQSVATHGPEQLLI